MMTWHRYPDREHPAPDRIPVRTGWEAAPMGTSKNDWLKQLARVRRRMDLSPRAFAIQIRDEAERLAPELLHTLDLWLELSHFSDWQGAPTGCPAAEYLKREGRLGPDHEWTDGRWLPKGYRPQLTLYRADDEADVDEAAS